MAAFHLLRLNNIPILEQLRIEEALLRVGQGNWCLINSGAPPAVVMGISGKPERLVHLDRLQQDSIPLIKRFSGGGTVYIDPDTVFVTFICETATIPIHAQPKSILEWTATIYHPLFQGFEVRENDYVFGDRKFGGNAQYIQKNRWLHHTSFLWAYNPEKMHYLKLPERRPQYRGERSHEAFLCSLQFLFNKKETLVQSLCKHFENVLQAQPIHLDEIEGMLKQPHRKTTIKLE